MTAGQFLLFIATGTVAAAAPGPNILYTLSQSVRYGSAATLPMVIGLGGASAVYGLASILGAGSLLLAAPEVVTAARWLAAAYFLQLGAKQWRTASSGLEIEEAAGAVPKRTLLRSFVVGLSNPKVMLYYMVLIPQFVNPETSIAVQLTFLVALQVLIKVAVLLAYTVLARPLRRWLRGEGRARLMNRSVGAMLIVAAVLLVAPRLVSAV